MDQYRARVRSLLTELVDQMNPVTDLDSFEETLVECFSNAGHWIYAHGGH